MIDKSTYSERIAFIETIKQLTEHLRGVNWNIQGFDTCPDLTGFTEQKTDIPIFPVKFIKQEYDLCGFCGIIFFQIQYSDLDCRKIYLHISFSGSK